jgi:hypothetical protein
MFLLEISMGEALKSAYKEYLERMIAQTEDLCVVDSLTVPEDQEVTVTMTEFADFV